MKGRTIAIITYFLITFFGFLLSESHAQNDRCFTKAEDYTAMIPTKVIREIELPKGYHEGLFIKEGNIWVNNGKGGKTWVIELASGAVISEIEPVATFSEGITAAPGGKYWITDWDTKKLYLVKIEENRMVAESEIPLGPSHPTGVSWNGSYLYVITWTSGMGTNYHLLKMDKAGNVIQKVRIKNIPEPSQLAWDGKDLWISSWFNRRVYKIDVETLQIKGYFRSHIKEISGIVWDGRYFWVTGTSANLYQIEILS